ncbi:hypothetical protein [Pleionea mediterranea]|uniref:Zn-dependent PLC domain-containing protein n=1 Tax=Pleionea mediterranea TaxID=523701 RepID=A0A316FVS0_9GAMM|nr:hypothetical protein [Pleionea mediterranea]PWK52821.1 hypothetical protein C8D97_10439 [Pleionea mediterranea]
MNFKYAMFFIVFCVTSNISESHEVYVHEAMTHRAITTSNLNNSQVIFDIYKELNFSGRSFLQLAKQAAIDEDTGNNSLKHFYDPQNNRGLFGIVESAKKRAVIDLLPKFREAQWQGNKAEQANLLGSILHLIEDMSQVQHTRNDDHCNDFLKCYLTTNGYLHKPSEYEKYTLGNIGGLNFSGYYFDYRDFKTLDSFFHNNTFSGIADYTSNNLLSVQTMFKGTKGDMETHSDFPMPSPNDTFFSSLNYESDDGTAYQVEYLYGNVTDKLTGGSQVIPLAQVGALGFFGKLNLLEDDFVFAQRNSVVIPRGVGYAREAINFLYDTGNFNIEVESFGFSSTHLNITKTSPGAFEKYDSNSFESKMAVKAYVENEDGSYKLLGRYDVESEQIPNITNQNDSLKIYINFGANNLIRESRESNVVLQLIVYGMINGDEKHISFEKYNCPESKCNDIYTINPIEENIQEYEFESLTRLYGYSLTSSSIIGNHLSGVANFNINETVMHNWDTYFFELHGFNEYSVVNESELYIPEGWEFDEFTYVHFSSISYLVRNSSDLSETDRISNSEFITSNNMVRGNFFYYSDAEKKFVNSTSSNEKVVIHIYSDSNNVTSFEDEFWMPPQINPLSTDRYLLRYGNKRDHDGTYHEGHVVYYLYDLVEETRTLYDIDYSSVENSDLLSSRPIFIGDELYIISGVQGNKYKVIQKLTENGLGERKLTSISGIALQYVVQDDGVPYVPVCLDIKTTCEHIGIVRLEYINGKLGEKLVATKNITDPNHFCFAYRCGESKFRIENGVWYFENNNSEKINNKYIYRKNRVNSNGITY